MLNRKHISQVAYRCPYCMRRCVLVCACMLFHYCGRFVSDQLCQFPHACPSVVSASFTMFCLTLIYRQDPQSIVFGSCFFFLRLFLWACTLLLKWLIKLWWKQLKSQSSDIQRHIYISYRLCRSYFCYRTENGPQTQRRGEAGSQRVSICYCGRKRERACWS